VRATEAIKSALNRLNKDRKVRRPHGSVVPIRYDSRTYRLRPNAGIVSNSTVARRKSIVFACNPHANRLLAQATGFDSADLIYRKGRFWLHLVLTIPDIPFSPTGNVVGVERGLNRPAGMSTNKFFGEKRWEEIDRRYFRLRRALQSKGTRSAKHHLRRLAGKGSPFPTRLRAGSQSAHRRFCLFRYCDCCCKSKTHTHTCQAT
jgi:hypothetical protein